MGLQTVTWLFDGELVHRDSLGSEQSIRPGQLNLMTAGHGVAHAEENPAGQSRGMHGVQLWVAQPEATRHGPAAFEHHGELPHANVGAATATVLLGSYAGTASAARSDGPIVGVDLSLPAGVHELPLDSSFEHAVVVTEGALRIENQTVPVGVLGHLGARRAEVRVTVAEPTRALLLGGEPFPDRLLMWWNFVARTRDEVELATKEWNVGSERFGTVPSTLERIPAPDTPWRAT
jgi:redox-sensitive bicupin YhaK (pirin superfamily)